MPWDGLIVDPGFGFGKTPDHNLALLAGLDALRVLGRPGAARARRASRRWAGCSTCRPTSGSRRRSRPRSLGVAAGVDIVRVHDVRENVRAARVADAVLRGWRPAGLGRGDAPVTDRIILDGMAFEGTHGVYPRGAA